MWKSNAKIDHKPKQLSGMDLEIGKVYRFRHTGELCTPVKGIKNSKVGLDGDVFPYVLFLLNGPTIGELFNPSSCDACAIPTFSPNDFELVECTVTLTVG